MLEYTHIGIYLWWNLQRMTVPVYWYFGTWLCVFTEHCIINETQKRVHITGRRE